jgi:hypothetical protein
MNQRTLVRSVLGFGIVTTLTLGTAGPALAQMPPRVPTPNDTLVSTLQVNTGGHTWINWRLYLSELLPQLFR